MPITYAIKFKGESSNHLAIEGVDAIKVIHFWTAGQGADESGEVDKLVVFVDVKLKSSKFWKLKTKIYYDFAESYCFTNIIWYSFKNIISSAT